MVSSAVIATVISSYVPLIAIILIRATLARELRPSDHGLEYQSPQPSRAKSSPQMTSFFKGSTSPSPPSPPSEFALPNALNSTDDDMSWLNGGRGDGGGGDHVRHVMLVSSLVCGITGTALLVASAFIYFFRSQNRNPPPSSSSCLHNNNTNTNRK